MSAIKDVGFPPASWEGSPDNWPTNWQHVDELGSWEHANVGDSRSYILDTVDSWPDGQGLIWRISFPILRLGHGGMDSSTTSYSIWIDGLTTGAYLGLTVFSGATIDGRPYVQFSYTDADGNYRSGSDAIFDDGWEVTNEQWVRLRRNGGTLVLEYSSEQEPAPDDWTGSAPIESFGFGDGDGGWRVRFAANYASNWFGLGGSTFTTSSISLLYMADRDGAFVNVGNAQLPLNIRTAEGTWLPLDGSGNATLRMRMPDDTWKTVIG